MSSRSEETCKNVMQCNEYSVENVPYPLVINDKQHASEEHPARVVVLDNRDTFIEVTVKTKGHKRTHTMVSSTPNGEKHIEEKQGPSSIAESGQNWGQNLREQTRPVIKKSLENFSLKNQYTKKISYEPRDNKIRQNVQKQSKFGYSNAKKHLDVVPVKQVVSQKKSKERLNTPVKKIPSNVSLACSTESIFVVDKEVQCDSIFDGSNGKFGSFNPVRTLGLLMKELEYLVKDEKSNKIFSNMNEALLRISMEPVKSTGMDSETLALRARLDTSTVQLEEMSKRMNTLCESLYEERDCLKRKVHEQLKLLEEAHHKQSELESTVSILKERLDEASKTIESKNKMIFELQQENKRNESTQKIIEELKMDLTKQTEVARQRLLEMQYLMLERDKLSVVSSHKDSQLNDFRDVIKKFQNQITEQLMSLRQACTMEESSNLQDSVIQGGLACSSPSPTTSERSNVLTFGHDISDVSLSTIEHNLPTKEVRKMASKKTSPLTSIYRAKSSVAKKKLEDVSESRNRDSAHLEFISLPGGESSRTILLAPYKDQIGIDQTEMKDKDHTLVSKTKDSNYTQQLVSTSSKIVGTKSSQRFVEEGNEKVSYKKNLSKTRKPLHSDSKRKHANRTLEESSKFVESNFSSNLINSDIKEQFQHIFDDAQRKSKISVSIPSPPRHYPHPDWTDSSLPSISVASESNIIQSNNI